MKATLSPAVHEATIARHFAKHDPDDPILKGLHAAVASARVIAGRAQTMTDAVLHNALKTESARHKEARAAGFELLERATRELDAALKATTAEIDTLRRKTHGPVRPRDPVQLLRADLMRARLANMPEAERNKILATSVKNGRDDVIGAVLDCEPWEVGIGEADQNMVRSNWATRNHASDLDRLARLEKALTDAERAGSATIDFISNLTNSTLVESAEAMQANADAAIRAVKAG